MRDLPLLLPDWPAPPNVRAASTTRAGGASRPPFGSLNLGGNTGDDPDAVAGNRRRLRARLGLAQEPAWLRQVHGAEVIEASTDALPADAAWTDVPGRACAVLTADCLPVLFCNRSGTRVAAAHGGWRGLVAGILENTVNVFDDAPTELMAWLGPAIGPESFEIGPEVREAFLDRWPQAANAFARGRNDRWYGDLYAIARLQLNTLGVDAIHGGHWCTLQESERFFSFRRDGQTGRMATLVWLDDSAVAE